LGDADQGAPPLPEAFPVGPFPFGGGVVVGLGWADEVGGGRTVGRGGGVVVVAGNCEGSSGFRLC
jgi:hypothetical protein